MTTIDALNREVVFRHLSADDAATMLSVWQMIEGNGLYGAALFRQQLSQQSNCCHFGAISISDRRGMGLVSLGWLGEFGKLTGLYVDPECRHRSIGFGLVSAACAKAADLGLTHVDLEVEQENLAAIQLYQRCGFRLIGSSDETCHFRYPVNVT